MEIRDLLDRRKFICYSLNRKDAKSSPRTQNFSQKGEEKMKRSEEEKEIQEGKVFAAISYISAFCILTLILKRENKFALFHGKQGLVIFIGEIAAGILRVAIPLLGRPIFSLAVLVLGLLSLFGIMQSLMGRYWKCPFIYNFAEKITL